MELPSLDCVTFRKTSDGEKEGNFSTFIFADLINFCRIEIKIGKILFCMSVTYV